MENAGGEKIKIGICVMQKKVLAMEDLLTRLEAFGEFEIIRFGDKIILEDPIERWPLCDCLIAFYSSGFPLKKAEDYAALRQPFLINHLQQQHWLQDRREVYARLHQCGVPVPRNAVVNREYPNQEVENFVEEDDLIRVGVKKIKKPFVEKPVDGDDHSIMIYYPSYAGGGMKELFRKVGNKSSSFHPDVNRVRRGGSFIYEEFMATGGKDIKVYSVGHNYAHAEARKSPVVDGTVIRNHDGKEVRCPVLLSRKEKDMAINVVNVFKQTVCGLDILRTEHGSYVCDVNGWSCVKNSNKYYDDAAFILRKMILDARAPHLSSSIPLSLSCTAHEPRQPYEPSQSEELLCVVAVIRHGDRTPKQKIKLKTTEEKLLQVMVNYNEGRSRSETKLKRADQLKELLDAMTSLVPCSRSEHVSHNDAEDIEYADKLKQVKAVLEEGGGHFSGINRKVQFKPSKWVKIAKADGEGEEFKPVEALMVVKYGGILTHAGKTQAEELGGYFRSKMYPGDGLLRLHSTHRHDLKIYSSDEGRVQMSAAAFAKCLLNLDGELTPILVSLLSKDFSMLDGLNSARIEMAEAKAMLNDIIISGAKHGSSSESSDTPWMADGAGIPSNASELLWKLLHLTKEVSERVRVLANEIISAEMPCGNESFVLMSARWRKLAAELYNEHKGRFDTSKISDIYDCCKYDLLHNAKFKIGGLVELLKVAQSLAHGVIHNEYGINPIQKLNIGSKVAHRLVSKILKDLKNARKKAADFAESKDDQSDNSIHDDDDCSLLDPKYADQKALEPQVLTRLYFTSESHIHSLLNVLRYANLHESLCGEDGFISFSGLESVYNTRELDYMSGIILRMFENSAVPFEDPKRFRIEMSFSRGADSSLLEKGEEVGEHRLPILGPESLQEVGSYLTLEHLEMMLAIILKTEEQPREQKSRKRAHHVMNE